MMNLFKVDGNLSIDTSNIYVDDEKMDLLVCNISQDAYYKLVIDGECKKNVLYVVSSNSINAYGEQIQNVCQPSLSSDAATKGYVDEQVSQISSSCSSLTRNDVVEIAKDVFKSSLKSILSAL